MRKRLGSCTLSHVIPKLMCNELMTLAAKTYRLQPSKASEAKAAKTPHTLQGTRERADWLPPTSLGSEAHQSAPGVRRKMQCDCASKTQKCNSNHKGAT